MNSVTIGLDLGDQRHEVCILDGKGEKLRSFGIPNTKEAILEISNEFPGSTTAMEAGMHSPWISRQLTKAGHEVLVGNSRKLRLIWQSREKTDVRDAEMLARVARFDPNLLYPIHHRSEYAQIDLAALKARNMLVKSRTTLINHVRGSLKALGFRMPSCSSPNFHKVSREHLTGPLKECLEPIVEIIEQLNLKIHEYESKIDTAGQEKYPETQLLRRIAGVGPITSMAFVLTLEEPEKFKSSRSVGAFLGLTPRRDQSGDTDRQLGITKAGNSQLRRLLIGSAQYIMGPFGPDSSLRRFGLRMAERGGQNGKRRALVAVARKLTVLMHRLWVTGEVYDPFYSANQSKRAVSEAA